MNLLPSGLPSMVVDEEVLARFITSESHFNLKGTKPTAFMPEIEARETSVIRHNGNPLDELWAIGEAHVAQGRTIYGAAFIKAKKIRERELDVIADEPPPRHAAIRNWPWVEPDQDLRKAKHKELAILLAADSDFLKKNVE